MNRLLRKVMLLLNENELDQQKIINFDVSQIYG